MIEYLVLAVGTVCLAVIAYFSYMLWKYRMSDEYPQVLHYCGISSGGLLPYIKALHDSLEEERMRVARLEEKNA